jgi:CHASE3 domain sensor protein
VSFKIIGDDIGARFMKASRRNAQLRRRLSEVLQEIEAEKRSEIFALRQRVEDAEAKGGDPLGDLAKQLLHQIAERKSELRATDGKAATGATRSSTALIIALTLSVLAPNISTSHAENLEDSGLAGHASEALGGLSGALHRAA